MHSGEWRLFWWLLATPKFLCCVPFSLEVQPPCFIGWFPNHHYFSRGLSSSKKNHHFWNGGWLPGFCFQTPEIFLKKKSLASKGMGTDCINARHGSSRQLRPLKTELPFFLTQTSSQRGDQNHPSFKVVFVFGTVLLPGTLRPTIYKWMFGEFQAFSI